AARDRRRVRVRRQQRGRLHDHRRIHPGVRHRSRGPHRPRARPRPLGCRRICGHLAAHDAPRGVAVRPHRPPHDVHHRLGA
ncbi:hypothetical protein HMPREF0072_0606, partial [Anaerococcus lactolyticus ATCC 51172]